MVGILGLCDVGDASLVGDVGCGGGEEVDGFESDVNAHAAPGDEGEPVEGRENERSIEAWDLADQWSVVQESRHQGGEVSDATALNRATGWAEKGGREGAGHLEEDVEELDDDVEDEEAFVASAVETPGCSRGQQK